MVSLLSQPDIGLLLPCKLTRPNNLSSSQNFLMNLLKRSADRTTGFILLKVLETEREGGGRAAHFLFALVIFFFFAGGGKAVASCGYCPTAHYI